MNYENKNIFQFPPPWFLQIHRWMLLQLSTFLQIIIIIVELLRISCDGLLLLNESFPIIEGRGSRLKLFVVWPRSIKVNGLFVYKKIFFIRCFKAMVEQISDEYQINFPRKWKSCLLQIVMMIIEFKWKGKE